MKRMFTVLAIVCSALGARGQRPLTPGNILIYRVGKGDSTLTAAAFPVFLDERSITLGGILSGSAPIVQSIALPATTSNADTITNGNHILTATGNGGTEGLLTRSVNGKYVVFGGYEDASDTSKSSVALTSAKINPRVLGRIDANGVVNTTTACTNLFSTYAVRSVVSPDGNIFMATGGTTGVKYAILGSKTSNYVSEHNTTTAPTQAPTCRGLEIIGGQLYVSSQSSIGSPAEDFTIATVGTGVDTAVGETLTSLSGIDTISNYYATKYAASNPALGVKRASPYQFTILTLTGGQVLYLADNTTNDSVEERGIVKYSLVGSTWVYNGATHAKEVTGLVGENSGDTVLLLATSYKGLYGTFDYSGWNEPPTNNDAVVIDTALANTEFRGVSFTPGLASGLPVALKSFNTSLVNSYAKLSWSTATEINFKGFEIEKSSDGKSFASIGIISANGKPSSYVFTDPTKLDGLAYYHLKMINQDGSYSYSSTVELNNKESLKMSVYPNPVSSAAIISHPEATAGAILKISSIDGKTLATCPVQTGATETSVDVSRLAKGSYIVSFEDNNIRAVTQFVK
jgi:hypothetical protein